MKKYLLIKNFYIFIFIISIFTILSALYIENIIGAQPCTLCKYQRLPYILSIFICLFGLKNVKNNFWIYLIAITFFLSFLLSGYHFGIENSIFPEFSLCNVDNLSILDKELLLQSLSQVPQNCKDVNFKVIGLSLATINVLISIFILIISIALIRNEKKNR
tara:strand:- start:1503 stop:1985 length:483 start_codon:yes stop_codon:yes gene_type:complete